MLAQRLLENASARPRERALARHPLVSFAAIGVVCTAAFALLYSALRTTTGPIEANLAALSATIGLNFLANRSLTFRHADGPILRQAAGYLAVYLLGLGASSLALGLALKLVEHPSSHLELALAVAASGLATVVRFLMLSRWVFRPRESGANG